MEPRKTFELGVSTFGNTPRTADGCYGPTARVIRDALETVHVAEEVGLDCFDFGEHPTPSMPVVVADIARHGRCGVDVEDQAQYDAHGITRDRTLV